MGFLLKTYGPLSTSRFGRSRSRPATARTAHPPSHRPARISGHPQPWPIQAGQGRGQGVTTWRTMPVPRPTRWASGIGMLPHRQAGAAVRGLTLSASGGGGRCRPPGPDDPMSYPFGPGSRGRCARRLGRRREGIPRTWHTGTTARRSTARLVGHDPAVVHRLVPVLTEDGEVDPGEVGTGPGAPDDVGHLQDPLVGQQGVAIAHPDDPGEALDPRGGEILGLDPNQRGAVGDEPGAQFAADRRVHGQHAMADDPEQQGLEDVPRCRPLDPERDVAGLLARQPGRVPAGDLEGDLRAELPAPTTRTPPCWSWEGLR